MWDNTQGFVVPYMGALKNTCSPCWYVLSDLIDLFQFSPTVHHGCPEGTYTLIHDCPEGTCTLIHDCPEGTCTLIHDCPEGTCTLPHDCPGTNILAMYYTLATSFFSNGHTLTILVKLCKERTITYLKAAWLTLLLHAYYIPWVLAREHSFFNGVFPLPINDIQTRAHTLL